MAIKDRIKQLRQEKKMVTNTTGAENRHTSKTNISS
jgi:hypothetical protein